MAVNSRSSTSIVGSIFEKVASVVRGENPYMLGVATYIRSLSCPYCGSIGDALVVSRVVFRRLPRVDLNSGVADRSMLDGYAVNRVSCSSCGGEFYVLVSALRSREKGRFSNIDVRIVKTESPLSPLLEEERPFSGVIMDGVLVFKYPELLFYDSYESFVEQVGSVKPAFLSLRVGKDEEGRSDGGRQGGAPAGVTAFNLENRRWMA